jgi:cytochrome P450
MAGSDSVGHLILWTLIFLDKNPEWTAALREEVETFDTTTFNGMEKLPKLKATILEIERFRPPTVVLGQVAKQDFEYNGLTVPTGTNLLHVSAMTHFMPEFYEAPHAFKPERFLGLDAPKARMHGTFGGGPHVCAGQFISRVQAPLVLALFLKHFTWEFLAPVSGHAVVGSSITPREKELPVRIRKR